VKHKQNPWNKWGSSIKKLENKHNYKINNKLQWMVHGLMLCSYIHTSLKDWLCMGSNKMILPFSCSRNRCKAKTMTKKKWRLISSWWRKRIGENERKWEQWYICYHQFWCVKNLGNLLAFIDKGFEEWNLK
jgi:hypothetical protein